MRTLSLSPAGKQPVRIATRMAIAPTTDHFAKVGKMVKSIIHSAAKALPLISGAAAFLGAVAYEASGSSSAAVILVASLVAFFAGLAPSFLAKGGTKREEAGHEE